VWREQPMPWQCRRDNGDAPVWPASVARSGKQEARHMGVPGEDPMLRLHCTEPTHVCVGIPDVRVCGHRGSRSMWWWWWVVLGNETDTGNSSFVQLSEADFPGLVTLFHYYLSFCGSALRVTHHSHMSLNSSGVTGVGFKRHVLSVNHYRNPARAATSLLGA
jgi:hypothetical protein